MSRIDGRSIENLETFGHDKADIGMWQSLQNPQVLPVFNGQHNYIVMPLLQLIASQLVVYSCE